MPLRFYVRGLHYPTAVASVVRLPLTPLPLPDCPQAKQARQSHSTASYGARHLLQKHTGDKCAESYHASYHRCELASKAAITTEHAFLDLLADMLQCAALFWE